MDTKKEIQSILSSLIVSSAKGLTVYRLRRDYKEETGQDLPYYKFGHNSFEQFLSSIPETCQVNGHGPDAIVIPVINAKNKHINDMILKQRPPKSTSRYKPPRRSRGIYSNAVPQSEVYKLPKDFVVNPNSHNISLPPPHDYVLEQRNLKTNQYPRQSRAPRFQNQSYNSTQSIPPLIPPLMSPQNLIYNINHTHPPERNSSQNQTYDKNQFVAQRYNSQTESYNKANKAVEPQFNSLSNRITSQNQIYNSLNQYKTDESQFHSSTVRSTSQNQIYNSSNQYEPQFNSQTDRNPSGNQCYNGANYNEAIESKFSSPTERNQGSEVHFNSQTDRNTSDNQSYGANHSERIEHQFNSQTDRKPSGNQCYNGANYNEAVESKLNSPTERNQGSEVRFNSQTDRNTSDNQSYDANHSKLIEPQFNSQTEINTSTNTSYNNTKHESIADRFALQFAKHCESEKLKSVASGSDQHVSDKPQCDGSGDVSAYKYHDDNYEDCVFDEFNNSADEFSDGEDENFVYHSDDEDAINTELQALTLNDNTKEYYKELYNHTAPQTEEIYQLGIKEAGHESRVNRKVKEKLQKLISDHPDGIWCSKLLKLYNARFKSRLEPQEYGFTSVIQMCDDMPDIFHCVRPNRTDWKLYDRKNPKPGICGTQELSNYLRTISQSPKLNNTEPPLPDSFEKINAYLYPSTVIKLGEYIPKQWLEENNEEDDEGFIELVVAEIYDPSKFWIQLKGKNTSDALYKLMDDMQQFYTENFETYRMNQMNASLGLYCAALFMHEFHRALIIKNFGDGTIKVYYIDYGTVGEVLVNETCLLHKSFSLLPQQAIRSRLSSVRPKDPNTMWPRTAQQYMLSLVREKFLIGTIISIDEENKILNLVITDTTSPHIDIHINDELINNGYAVIGDKANVCSTSRAIVPNVHLYPNFDEIETGTTPCLSDLIKLLRLGQTYETIFDAYFQHPSSNCSMHASELFDLSCCSSTFEKSVLYVSDQIIKFIGDEEQESPEEVVTEHFLDKVNSLEIQAENIEFPEEIEVTSGDVAAEETDSATEEKNTYNSNDDYKVEDESLNVHDAAEGETNTGFWETDNLKGDDLWKRDNFKEKPRNTDLPYCNIKTPPGFENFKPRHNNPEYFGYPSMPIPACPPYFPQYPAFPPVNYFPNYSIYNNYMNNSFAMNQFMLMQQQQNFYRTTQNFVETQQFRPQNRCLLKPDYLDATPNNTIYSNISNYSTNTNISPTELYQSPAVLTENNSPKLSEDKSITDECIVESNESLSNCSGSSDVQYYSNDEDDQQLNDSHISNTSSIENINHSSLLRSEHICERFVLKISISNKTLHIIKIIDELYVVSQEIITSLLDSEATLKKWLKSKHLDNFSFPNKLINLLSYENIYNQLKSFTIPGLYAPNNLGCNVRLTLLKDVFGIIEKYGDQNILPDLKSGIEHVKTECLWTILDSTD